uniref:Helitron helicase-like domain-containing protein n=3 Tax=Aegilops tauschii subsp. strangulata TaxID=200361 RepID=A0A453CC73_AEGTS
MWHQERSKHNTNKSRPTFGLCCKEGKVKLPPLKKPPAYLQQLLTSNEKGEPSNYRDNIRNYNPMFAFTSMGGQVDYEINKKGGAPYVFRLNGQNYHQIGTLLPKDNGDNALRPKFAQLYIYDTENEVRNRMQASTSKERKTQLDEGIVSGLLQMLDEHNELVKSFRMARDRYQESDLENVRLRLIGTRSSDGRQYNLPNASEIAALIIGEQTGENVERDIIVENKDRQLQRISELHPSFMSMQYPLLFPYGEDGFRPEIELEEKKDVEGKRKYVTMMEYYAYRIQQRLNQSVVLQTSGKLFLQFIVDAATCIEQWRLHHIMEVRGINSSTTRMQWPYVGGLDIQICLSLSHATQSGQKYRSCWTSLMHDTYPQVKHLGVSLDLNFSTGNLLYRDCNSTFRMSKWSCSQTQLTSIKLYIDLQFTK